jgi:hypothetical protein
MSTHTYWYTNYRGPRITKEQLQAIVDTLHRASCLVHVVAAACPDEAYCEGETLRVAEQMILSAQHELEAVRS